ncbi:MAG: SPFH domain-containing protein [Tannerella sp.]|jgi:regulator of protease activity HflC (stomatin/prohibitin superfamily)|nr:SPFH domain-containing protein [Tannerella sp.]
MELTKERIFSGMKLNGIMMLVFNFLLLIAVVALIVFGANKLGANPNSVLGIVCIVLAIIGFIKHMIFWLGFMRIEPNEARVLVFFGKYRGTVKEDGYYWVNPFFAKKPLTLRARNLDAEPIKVNDKKGNPIMIGQVLVWRVVDTYKASFDIDSSATINAAVPNKVGDKMKSYEQFVKVQSDAALRYVAGMYAYDNMENEDEKLTLRSGGEEINEILEKQLNERLAIAGIEVMEARVNYLAYAPEIAAVMLRRQQAEAIIAAREKIVEGAVGMVKNALNKLSDERIIELDDEKKAAMVSNLLVILCGDERATPIVNTGTLYN